jgi:hypothetical protein
MANGQRELVVHLGTRNFAQAPLMPSPVSRPGQVCLHGLGTNLGVFDDLVPQLLQSGKTVIRYDYFNHGYRRAPAKKSGLARDKPTAWQVVRRRRQVAQDGRDCNVAAARRRARPRD